MKFHTVLDKAGKKSYRLEASYLKKGGLFTKDKVTKLLELEITNAIQISRDMTELPLLDGSLAYADSLGLTFNLPDLTLEAVIPSVKDFN